MNHRLAVTSVEGLTGWEIARAAKKHSSDFQSVVGFSTNPEKCKSSEFEIRRFDLEDHSSKQFEGFDFVIVIPPSSHEKVMIAKKYLECVKRCNINHVILVSSWMPRNVDVSSEKCPKLSEFKKIESMIESSGVRNYSIARLGFYMENFLLYSEQLRSGTLPLPLGERKMAPVCVVDAAEGIIKLAKKCSENWQHQQGQQYQQGQQHQQQHLQQQGQHGQQSWRECTFTGNELQSGRDFASAASEGLGRKVQYENISREKAHQILSSVPHFNQAEMNLLLEMYDCGKQGGYEHVTDNMQTLIGRKGTTVREFFQKHRQTVCKE
jgi:hypothetical protein